MTKDEMRVYQAERRCRLKAGEPKPLRHSTSEWLTTFQMGETRWVETTLTGYATMQRRVNMPRSRRPDAIRQWQFETALFTAVSASKAGDIAFLVKVTRAA